MKHLVDLVFPFGDLGLLGYDLGAVVCPFVWAQDACERLEFGAGHLGLHEGATLGIGCQTLGPFTGKRRCNLDEELLFLSYVFLALSLRS
jgi:hypothetical protein